MLGPVLHRHFAEGLALVIPFAPIIPQPFDASRDTLAAFIIARMEQRAVDRFPPCLQAVSHGHARYALDTFAALGPQQLKPRPSRSPFGRHDVVRHVIVAAVSLRVEPQHPVVKVFAIRLVEIDNARNALDNLKAPDRVVDRLAQVPSRMNRLRPVDFERQEAPFALCLVDFCAEVGTDHRAAE